MANRARQLADELSLPIADAVARHAESLAAKDGEGLLAASDEYRALGDRVTAADAAAQAAVAFSQSQQRRRRLYAAAIAQGLSDECGGISHPGASESDGPSVDRTATRNRRVGGRGYVQQGHREEPYMSVRSVEGHLYRACQRVGANSREELAPSSRPVPPRANEPNRWPIPEFPRPRGRLHRYLELPGLHMHVAEAGSGEPLLLLHGYPQHWWGWYKVLPALAQHYRVICPDLRGAGWTDDAAGRLHAEQLVAVRGRAARRPRARPRAGDGPRLGRAGSPSCCACITPTASNADLTGDTAPGCEVPPAAAGRCASALFQFAIATPVLGPWLVGKGGQRRGPAIFSSTTRPIGTRGRPATSTFVAPFREPRGVPAPPGALYRTSSRRLPRA